MKLLLSKKIKYIVAISGGVDSMVLLHYLIKNNFNIEVVHFNHQKRKESILDHNLILDVTTKHDIKYHYITLSITDGNFQEEARNERYNHLVRIANGNKAKDIITAHHGDDLVETILMKLIRGSNLLGYSAMQKTSVINGITYHRPLLDFTKESIYDYAKLNNVSFNEDYSNFTNDYFRNRLRNNVIPLIKEENKIVDHFNNFSEQAYLASNFIRSQTLLFLNNKSSFILKEFNELHDAVKNDLISYFFESANAEKSFDKIRKIIKQINHQTPNLNIDISKDFSINKSYDLISLIRKENTGNINREITLNISHKKPLSPYNSYELCYNELSFPIKFRNRKEGDVLSFNFGHKKLKNFLIEKKIPKHLRDSLTIITDANDVILCIPDIYLNQTLGTDNSIFISIKE